MKSQKEQWKPDLNLVSQGCQHEKKLNITPKIRPERPGSIVCILTLDHQSQVHKVPTKLLMWRSQLREQICQTSKWPARMKSLVVLNRTNIDLWEIRVSHFGGPVTKNLPLNQGSRVQIQGVKFFSWWLPGEPRFKSGFHNSFWNLVVPDRISWMTLKICKWNLGRSFG
jgi:hypothetical protein